MWWFLKRQANPAAAPAGDGSRLDSAKELLALVPDMAFVRKQDVALKIWLPRVVAESCRIVASYYGLSQSAWLRERLVVYVYGVAAAAASRVREDDDRPMFARGPSVVEDGKWMYKVPQLGKNAVAFKLWMGAEMKSDLTLLASHAGLELSPFVREVIISDLLGHGSLPERAKLFEDIGPHVKDWEEGRDVPMMEVEAVNFHHLGEASPVWIEQGKRGGNSNTAGDR